MRITENSQYREMLTNLEQTSDVVAKFQTEVSSGKRLNAASDDPGAAAQDVGAYAQLSTLNSYSNAAEAASARLSVADSALNDIVNQLTAAKVAAQSAQGSPISAAQRDGAVATLQSVKQALASDLNTTFQGTYVFGGTKSTTPPFTVTGSTVSAYQGNNTANSVDVGSQTSVAITIDGQSITQGSDSSDVFNQLDALITAVQNGDTSGITAGITAVGRAFDRAVSAQTAVGTSLNRLSSQTARLTTMTTAAQSQISSLEDADMAAAITGLQKGQTEQQATIGSLATTQQQRTLMDYVA
jgi:flagellar hook-associated protein 3 FlgL